MNKKYLLFPAFFGLIAITFIVQAFGRASHTAPAPAVVAPASPVVSGEQTNQTPPPQSQPISASKTKIIETQTQTTQQADVQTPVVTQDPALSDPQYSVTGVGDDDDDEHESEFDDD